MTSTVTMPHEVRDLVKGYYHAWTSGNLELARFFLADQLKFRGSIDTLQTSDAFIARLRVFHRMLKGTRLVKEFYSAGSATLLYDCVTDSPAGTFRTAEYFSVSEGKICEIILVFDATLLRQIMDGPLG